MLLPEIFLFTVTHTPGGPQFSVLKKRSVNRKGSAPLTFSFHICGVMLTVMLISMLTNTAKSIT